MTVNLFIEPYDATFVRLSAERSVLMELWETFTFKVPNHRYTPAYINAKKYGRPAWNGDIHLLNLKNKRIYKGLVPRVLEWAETKNIKVHDYSTESENATSLFEVETYFKKITKPEKSLRDYQQEAVADGIRRGRGLYLSTTASGKSLIMYSLIRWFKKKTLLIVPSTHLVGQMYGDFADYTADKWSVERQCSQIISGFSRENLNDVVITTWQSLSSILAIEKGKIQANLPWLNQFEVVIVDEVHQAVSQILRTIIEAMTKCKHRFGFTGTFDETELNHWVLEGLFNRVKNVSRASDLIERGILAKPTIYALILNYNNDTKKQLLKKFIELEDQKEPRKKYNAELEFLVGLEKRNQFISNLALSLHGNVIILYRFVDKHGQILYDLIRQQRQDNVFFISGDTSASERNNIRKKIEELDSSITIASSGTFAVGVNIVNLNNIIFGSPYRSRVRNLQSIGRGLRKGDHKSSCNVFDIVDDLSVKKFRNFTMSHFDHRLRMYRDEKFVTKIKRIQLEKD